MNDRPRSHETGKGNGTKVRASVGLALYYSILRWLPSSSMPTGRIARRLRASALRPAFGSFGDDVNIEHGAFFGDARSVHIGSRSGIGVNCRLHGEVHIGDDVMMGPDVVILAVSHGYSDPTIAMIDQSVTDSPVIVGDDVWIGTRAIILPGVTIGSHVIVGAGTVVTKSVPDGHCVVGGAQRVFKR